MKVLILTRDSDDCLLGVFLSLEALRRTHTTFRPYYN